MARHPTEEVIALVRLLLLETDAVSAIVGDRISGPSPARTGEVEGEDLYPRVVIDVVGGGAYGFGGLQNLLLHVYGYSRVSEGDAYRLADTIRPALRRTRLARDGISVKGMIEQVEEPTTGYNPDTSAYFARATYRVMATALAAGD